MTKVTSVSSKPAVPTVSSSPGTTVSAPSINVAPNPTRVPDKPRRRQPLSQRVFALQQIIPLGILAIVMFYEVTSHLIFQTEIHPILFAVETLTFGILGPAFTWITLNWVAREIRQRERAEGEADELNAMLQEMHHRIKNNLQTVADLLTLEMSRNLRPEVQESLRDSITRIKSIAASHELLSVESVGLTNITELARRRRGDDQAQYAESRSKDRDVVKGHEIYLGSKQATAFALVLNELIANAIEHGFRTRREGEIEIELDWDVAEVWMRVQDDGEGLPKGFSLNTSRGLGLQIARTLVEKDLRGKLALNRLTPEEVVKRTAGAFSNGTGTTTWVHFQRGVDNDGSNEMDALRILIADDESLRVMSLKRTIGIDSVTK